ncbi:MAG TPA: prepilin-type N-terminal cleavage/methylation domain-containing protein [Blastocatellia bacterium]|nr:prepilin-type N-terminal cleavage/methylation domain-containing protein [Blastocatellia bacterium]
MMITGKTSSNETYSATVSAGTTRESGFTLPELLIAMTVFVVIMGSVVALVTKSQTIFRTEQGVSEMDQNARLTMDFLTRDLQSAKENSIGLGDNFRPIYSYNGPEGKTDEITIISSDTESKIPPGALPLVPAVAHPFSVTDRYVEVLPSSLRGFAPIDVVNAFTPNEQMIISSVLQSGAIQFDLVQVSGAQVTQSGTIGLNVEPVQARGVESEVAFGSTYQGGFAMRPVSVKRYFVDRSDPTHPVFAYSVNGSVPIPIGRNVVAFQLRYLQVPEGSVEGSWVKEQSISHLFKTIAVEVTMSARTEIKGDKDSERLVTLASVIRPRFQPGGSNPSGSAPPSNGSGVPGGPGGPRGPGGPTAPGSDGTGIRSAGGPGGSGTGGDWGSGGPGMGAGGWNYQTRRVGEAPKLGERLNPEP